MSPGRNESAAGQSGAEGLISILRTPAKDTATALNAQCGKRAAIQAYCNGWLSIESCAELFRANPDWRSA